MYKMYKECILPYSISNDTETSSEHERDVADCVFWFQQSQHSSRPLRPPRHSSTTTSAMPWISFIHNVLTHPRHTKWISPLLVLGDALLCALVIWKISCEPAPALSRPNKPALIHATDTEIDWTTYMQQVSLYISGERDYPSIKGSTGPLVYPAAHVYIYTLLYHVTDKGRDILLGQIFFAALYLATLVVVIACYRQVGAPPYLFPLLVLSKRLHSIYMLRMFNDGVAAFALWVAIYLFLGRKWTAAVAIWSFGVAIKMTLVLLVPGIGMILLLRLGLVRSVGLGAMAVLIQVSDFTNLQWPSVGLFRMKANIKQSRCCLQYLSCRPTQLGIFLGPSSYLGNSCSNGQ